MTQRPALALLLPSHKSVTVFLTLQTYITKHKTLHAWLVSAGLACGQLVPEFPVGRAHHAGIRVFAHLVSPIAPHPPPPHVASLGHGCRDVPAATAQVRTSDTVT